MARDVARGSKSNFGQQNTRSPKSLVFYHNEVRFRHLSQLGPIWVKAATMGQDFSETTEAILLPMVPEGKVGSYFIRARVQQSPETYVRSQGGADL